MYRKKSIQPVRKKHHKKLFIFFVVCIFVVAPICSLAENFVGIKIYPENVGVFTVDGKQQFVAFGVYANGSQKNITQLVDWESSDQSIVKINSKGLATIAAGKTSGQVKINCSYPKKRPAAMGAIKALLLTPEPPKSLIHIMLLLLLKS